MGDLCWNSTSGVPTRVTHDAKRQWYSITEAFQIVTPEQRVAKVIGGKARCNM